MKTTFKEENNNFVMVFEGRLDTPSSAQVGRDMPTTVPSLLVTSNHYLANKFNKLDGKWTIYLL